MVRDWLLRQGLESRRSICRLTGISGRGLLLLLKRYNLHGTVVFDQRSHNARPSRLEAQLRQKLEVWLEQQPNASSLEVQNWLRQQGLVVHLSSAWRYLQRCRAKSVQG